MHFKDVVKVPYWRIAMNEELVALRQKYGEDYLKTFALVAKMSTARTLLAVVAMENREAIQMDVSNTFLHADLSLDVYMKLPQGYHHLGSRFDEHVLLDSKPLQLPMDSHVKLTHDKGDLLINPTPYQWLVSK
ncbi:hypothetical protein AgCh_014065 [Apium graveolens]